MEREGRIAADAFAAGVKTEIESEGPTIEKTIVDVIGRARARISGLEREALDITIAGGGPGAQLANVRAQEAQARRILDEQIRARGRGDVSNEAVRVAQEDLARIITERRSIEDQMASDAEQAAEESKRKAEEIKRKREEQDQAFLEALGFGRERAQERIVQAQTTEGLADDIAATRALRQLVLRQIETIKDRVKSAELRIDAIRELRRITRDLRREQRALRQQQREEIQERAAERNQLDISFAQTTENRRAEIAARLREVARLRRLQSATRKGTLEYKRLRNLIAEQQKAIDELRGQQEKNNDAQLKVAFAFLQRQRGFFANVIGNLIPGDMTQGIVGKGPGITVGFPPESEGGALTRTGGRLPGLEGFGGQVAANLVRERHRREQDDASTRLRGVTAGQGNTQIDLLRKIWIEVRRSNRGSDHPEAKQQRKTGATALDYGGGGASMAM